MTIDHSVATRSNPTQQGSETVQTAPPSGPAASAPTRAVPWHRAWPWLRLLSGPLAAAVAIMVLRSGAVPVYTEFTVGLGAVYALIVLSLSLLASWTGIWSIGHPALLAIGAYGVAFGSSHGWSLELSIAVVVVGCAVIGGFLG
jgi:branched-chain amino acid transport system ATP-binding protein